MGAIKDIKNYIFAKNCFGLICRNTQMKRMYDPKVTSLGILYFWHKVPRNTPEHYIDELIVGALLPIQEVMISMNLDGTIRVDYSLRAEDDKFYYYLIKVIPTFDTLSKWYFIKWGFILTGLGFLIYKFGWWEHREEIINSIVEFVESINMNKNEK